MSCIGREAYLDLLNDMVEAVPPYLGRIRAAIETANGADLDHQAHAMRGMVSYFGCVGLTRRLHALRGTLPAADQAAAIHAELDALWRQSHAAIKEWERTLPEFNR